MKVRAVLTMSAYTRTAEMAEQELSARDDAAARVGAYRPVSPSSRFADGGHCLRESMCVGSRECFATCEEIHDGRVMDNRRYAASASGALGRITRLADDVDTLAVKLADVIAEGERCVAASTHDGAHRCKCADDLMRNAEEYASHTDECLGVIGQKFERIVRRLGQIGGIIAAAKPTAKRTAKRRKLSHEPKGSHTIRAVLEQKIFYAHKHKDRAQVLDGIV